MRISDWSSDVCSSDLAVRRPAAARGAGGDRLPAAADGAIVRGGAGDGGGAGRGIARRKAARHRGVGAWRAERAKWNRRRGGEGDGSRDQGTGGGRRGRGQGPRHEVGRASGRERGGPDG